MNKKIEVVLYLPKNWGRLLLTQVLRLSSICQDIEVVFCLPKYWGCLPFGNKLLSSCIGIMKLSCMKAWKAGISLFLNLSWQDSGRLPFTNESEVIFHLQTHMRLSIVYKNIYTIEPLKGVLSLWQWFFSGSRSEPNYFCWLNTIHLFIANPKAKEKGQGK